MALLVFLLAVFGGSLMTGSHALPAGIEKSSSLLEPASEPIIPSLDLAEDEVQDSTRLGRSPQFGFYGDYDDYEYGSAQSRHHKEKHHHKKPHGQTVYVVPVQVCRGGYGCGGGNQKPHGGHGGYGGNGGSFATASAGSIGGGPHGGYNQANANSASFNVGPYTASFSSAQASSRDLPSHSGFDYY